MCSFPAITRSRTQRAAVDSQGMTRLKLSLVELTLSRQVLSPFNHLEILLNDAFILFVWVFPTVRLETLIVCDAKSLSTPSQFLKYLFAHPCCFHGYTTLLQGSYKATLLLAPLEK